MTNSVQGAPDQAGEILNALGGLAARLAAERGRDSMQITALKQCLAALDRIAAAVTISQNELLEYVRLCEEFQRRILDLAQSPALDRHFAEAGIGTFYASALRSLMLWRPSDLAGLLVMDQRRRYQLFRAIIEGQGYAAESLVREHGLFHQVVETRVPAEV